MLDEHFASQQLIGESHILFDSNRKNDWHSGFHLNFNGFIELYQSFFPISIGNV